MLCPAIYLRNRKNWHFPGLNEKFLQDVGCTRMRRDRERQGINLLSLKAIVWSLLRPWELTLSTKISIYFSILHGKLQIYETRKRFHIWLFSYNVSFSKVAWPGHRGMEAAKSAASTGKESVSDKTKISVFVTQRRVCRFSLLFYSFKRLHAH